MRFEAATTLRRRAAFRRLNLYNGRARWTIRKVFHFISPRAHYKCDAAVVWCYDNRFELVFRKMLKRLGLVYTDPIRIAGGAKCLAAGDKKSDREFLLEQIRASIRLHATETVILMVHSDCGAYGGLAAFKDDVQKEAQHHCAELHRAAAYLRSEIPALNVQTYFVNFEGVWDVAADAAQSLTA